jgi:hypothetical protein
MTFWACERCGQHKTRPLTSEEAETFWKTKGDEVVEGWETIRLEACQVDDCGAVTAWLKDPKGTERKLVA